MCLVFVGCDPSQSPPLPTAADRPSPIVDGDRERGEPAVVMLMHQYGGMCSASVIAPRVLLTAKHCVIDIEGSGNDLPVWGFAVYVGDSIFAIDEEYAVAEVRRTSGRSLDNSDIAVVILDRDFDYDFKRWEFTPWPGFERDATITAIGFGQTEFNDPYTAGSKYRRDGEVSCVGEECAFDMAGPDEFMTHGENTCQGDSGGPILFDDVVVGIVSRGEEGCTGYGWMTRVSGFADLIIGALEDTGACVPTSFEVCNGLDDDCWGGSDDGLGETCGCADGAAPTSEVCDDVDNDCNEAVDDLEACGCTDGAEPSEEVCDGVDNDCNGEIDEICAGLGEPCEQDEDCTTVLCRELDGARVCTADCTTGGEPCPENGWCDAEPCAEGACRSGGGRAGGLGSGCSTNGDCASGVCAALGGERRCARPCLADGLDCFADEVCGVIGGGCGLCSEPGGGGGRGLGEPCLADADCSSGRCLVEDEGCGEGCLASYCVQPCEDGSCPEGTHCRGDLCVRGPGSELTEPCREDGDCLEGRCVEHDGERRCVSSCEEGSCDEGLHCVDADFCWPEGQSVGDLCEAEGEACAGGAALCVAVGDGQVCVDDCSSIADCPAGLACVSLDGQGRCVPPAALVVPPTPSEGGCNCAAASGRSALRSGLALSSLLALALLGLRRRGAL